MAVKAPTEAGAGNPPRTDIDWPAWRARFPIFRSRLYINSCSYGALATDVESAFCSYLEDRRVNGSDWEHWVALYESLRQDYARLLAVTSDEIAVTASASAGIDAVASAMNFSDGRHKVVLSDFEFPTSSQIWYAQQPRGAEVVRVAADGPDDLLHRLSSAVDERTRIVAVTQVCYRNGMKLDVAAVAALARAHGAYCLVDGYQAVGTGAFDLRASEIDFYVGGTLKYLLGTAGIGFLYARRASLDALQPTATGWFAQEDVGAMDHTRHRPARSARKFEAGTPPVPNVYATRAGLAILDQIGLPAIGHRISALTARIVARAKAENIGLATPVEPRHRGAMVALRCRDAAGLVAALQADGIVTSWRDGNLRLSPHFYNTEADVDRVFEAIAAHRGLVS